MRPVPRPIQRTPARSGDPVVVTTGLTACPTCSGTELYLLNRTIDEEWVELRLCRRCHADTDLVLAIDRLTEAALAE